MLDYYPPGNVKEKLDYIRNYYASGGIGRNHGKYLAEEELDRFVEIASGIIIHMNDDIEMLYKKSANTVFEALEKR